MDNFEKVKNLKRILSQAFKNEDWFLGIGIGTSPDGYLINVYSKRDDQKEIVIDGITIKFHQSDKFKSLDCDE